MTVRDSRHRPLVAQLMLSLSVRLDGEMIPVARLHTGTGGSRAGMTASMSGHMQEIGGRRCADFAES